MPNYIPPVAPFPNQSTGIVQVGTTIAFVWNVENGGIGVGTTIEFVWDVDALIFGGITLAWDVAEALPIATSGLNISWQVEAIEPICRAYRAVKGDEGLWRGFSDRSAIMTRGPLVNDGFNRYYIVQDSDVPRYTTYDQLELDRLTRRELAPSNFLRLGVPQPQNAPDVSTAGGSGDPNLIVDRAYVYTWVSAYGEEGPPSDPRNQSGPDDGVWTISDFDIDVPFATERQITTIRIYRTVTSTFGTVQFHYVTDIAFGTNEFEDATSTQQVGSNFTLESTSWFPPPETLKGIVEHPNGFFVGFDGRDIYMSEPYRPHAWPPEYVRSTLGDIVGFGIHGTSIVVCTESFPYQLTGISPDSMVLTKNDTAEPCESRYGIVSMPFGVVYPGPNGLMLAGPNGIETITDKIITKEQWQTKYNPRGIDAARWQSSYVAFYSGEEGFLLSPADALYTFIELNEFWDNCGIQTDEYSGKVIIATGREIYEWNPPSGANATYVWESKEFDLPDPKNFGAFRAIFYGDPIPDDATIQKWRDYNAIRIQQPLGPVNWNTVNEAKKVVPDGINDTRETRQPIDGPVCIPVPPVGEPWPNADTLQAEFLANDSVVATVDVDNDGMFRLPAGFKATRWRIRLTGEMKVKTVKMAETGKELKTV